MLRVPLRTDIGDPVERLAAIATITQRLKEQNQAVSARTLTQISEQLPGRLVGAAQRTTMNLAMRTGMAMGTNTTVTNVPGSQAPLCFAGARLMRSFGAASLLDGSGLIHPIGSYCGEMAFVFTADRAMIPTPTCMPSPSRTPSWTSPRRLRRPVT